MKTIVVMSKHWIGMLAGGVVLMMLATTCHQPPRTTIAPPPSATKPTTAATTNPAAAQHHASPVDLSKWVGSYRAEDNCSGDFSYTVSIGILPATADSLANSNRLVLENLGGNGQSLMAIALDMLQLQFADQQPAADPADESFVYIAPIGKASRDKATGNIRLNYELQTEANNDLCYVTLVKQ